MGLRQDRRRINMGRRLAMKRFKNQLRRNVLASPGRHQFISVAASLTMYEYVRQIADA